MVRSMLIIMIMRLLPLLAAVAKFILPGLSGKVLEHAVSSL